MLTYPVPERLRPLKEKGGGRVVSFKMERVESPPTGAAAVAKTDGEPPVRGLWAGAQAATAARPEGVCR